MKKALFLLALLSLSAMAFAQSKKDLLENINQLNQKIGELNATISHQKEALEQADVQISALNKENDELKEQLANANAPKLLTYRDSLLDLREKYYTCETWQDQLKYVMEPERVRPLMEKYYKKKPYSIELLHDEFGIKLKKIQGKTHDLYDVDYTWMVKTEDGYKVDWEATVKYNPVSLLEMRSFPNKEYTIRDWVSDCQKYYQNDTWMQYGVGDDADYTFIKKNSPLAKKLQELIPMGDNREMIVKMKYIGHDSDIKKHLYEITDIVSENLSIY